MYLMYVDESGDTGLKNSPTTHFVLTGLVVHELRWRTSLEHLIRFRRDLRMRFGLKLREEFHTAALITGPGPLARIKKHDRLAMIRSFADTLAGMRELSLLNVVVDKRDKLDKYDVFEMAWKVLIQRFENTMMYRNFPGPKNEDDRGMLITDQTQDKKLQDLLRRMRRYNPVPSFGGFRDLPLVSLVEDPNVRNSLHSYYIQAVDMAAYLLSQHLKPNSYMKKKGGQNYWKRLMPICCKHIARSDPDGIVRL
jgi:hypothetical protein